MKRSTLAATIATRTGLSTDIVDRVLDSFSDTLLDAVSTGDGLAWPGLFTLDVVHRPARSGRNPQTGEPMQIPEADRPRLRAGTRLTTATRRASS